MTHLGTMVKTLPTRNRFSATSVDQLPHQLVAHLLYGHQLMLPIPDIDRTDYFLVFGANPMASNGSLMTVPDFPNRLRELKARDGEMVVFDPRRTETAKVATEHHFVKPGTDVYVLLAMLHVLFEEGLTAPPSYVDRLDEVASKVQPFTPERAERASGVPADEIRRIAREYAAADAAAAYGRIGVSTTAWGTVAQWAVQLLNLVTGNLDRVGGTMFTSPAIDVVGRGFIGKGHHGIWSSRVRGLPESGGELPVSVLREEIETPGDGQIRAVLTLSGNPVLSTPDGAALDRALAGLDFMASVDIYINETTRHADVILPPTSALERDHYDLVFQNFAVRNTARFTPAVFDKSRDQRHDWEIYRELARRITSRLKRKAPLKKRLLSRARLSVSPTFLIGQLLRTDKSGVKISDLRRSPSGVDLGPLQPGRFPERLFTRDKRIDAAPELVLEDLARLVGAGAAERRRPAADRPAPQVGQQLLDAQLHATHPRPRPAPAADASRGPGGPWHRGRQDGEGHVAGRQRRGRGAGHRRHDARRGLAPPRLRTPGRRHPDEPGRPGHRRLDQRPDRCRSDSTSPATPPSAGYPSPSHPPDRPGSC